MAVKGLRLAPSMNFANASPLTAPVLLCVLGYEYLEGSKRFIIDDPPYCLLMISSGKYRLCWIPLDDCSLLETREDSSGA